MFRGMMVVGELDLSMGHKRWRLGDLPRVRDGGRGGEKDPEFPIEGFDNRAAQNCDQLSMQVGICPGEADECKIDC